MAATKLSEMERNRREEGFKTRKVGIVHMMVDFGALIRLKTWLILG